MIEELTIRDHFIIIINPVFVIFFCNVFCNVRFALRHALLSTYSTEKNGNTNVYQSNSFNIFIVHITFTLCHTITVQAFLSFFKNKIVTLTRNH